MSGMAAYCVRAVSTGVGFDAPFYLWRGSAVLALRDTSGSRVALRRHPAWSIFSAAYGSFTTSLVQSMVSTPRRDHRGVNRLRW